MINLTFQVHLSKFRKTNIRYYGKNIQTKKIQKKSLTKLLNGTLAVYRKEKFLGNHACLQKTIRA